MLVPSPVARPRHEGKLQQCERIPERALDQRFHLRVCDTLALAQPHELPRISIRDSVQPQLGQACSLEAPLLPLPCRDQHSDRFRQQTAGHEDKRVGRGPIQPLGVVDQAKDRAVTRRLSEQAEERERAQETIVHLIGGQAERGAKRRRLRSGQTVDKRHARPDELMQRGERKLVLGLHAGAPKDLGLRGNTGAELEQRRLADARLPAKHQNTAPSLHGVRHQRFDPLALGLASDNHATDCSASRAVEPEEQLGRRPIGDPVSTARSWGRSLARATRRSSRRPVDAAVSRSGTSRSRQLSPNAPTMTTAAVRKTGCSATATAATYTAWTAGGSWWIAAGLAFAGACTPGGSAGRARAPSRLVKIAPKTETPIEPPICRNSVTRRRSRRRAAGSRRRSAQRARAPASPGRARARGAACKRRRPPSACRPRASTAGRAPTVASAVPTIGNGTVAPVPRDQEAARDRRRRARRPSSASSGDPTRWGCSPSRSAGRAGRT